MEFRDDGAAPIVRLVPAAAMRQAAAQAKGRERYEGFIEALGRRFQKGQSLLQDIPEDVARLAVPETNDDVTASE